MKRFLSMLLVAAMVLSLAACGGNSGSDNTGSTTNAAANEAGEKTTEKAPAEQAGSEAAQTEAPKAEGTDGEETSLVAVVTSDPGGLSPYGTNRGGKQAVRSAVFEALFWMDENKNLCPVLGKSYEYLGEGKYHVTLFDYITDSQGNALKASDVVFSLDKMIEDGHSNSWVGSLDTYSAVDEYTVELVFKNEFRGNFETLVCNLYCVTEAAWTASPDAMAEDPVGTGLYLYESGVSGSEYNFVKRDGYWQTDEQYICAKNTCNVDHFTLRIINDASTIAIALENGEIDYTQNIENADRGNFMNEETGEVLDGYTMKELINSSLIRMSFNCSEKSQCSDANLRKAIATAVDNAAVAYNAVGICGHETTGYFNPIWLDADADAMSVDNYYSYDPDAAKAFLDSSSYDGTTLKVLVQPNSNCTNAAVLIQAYCRAIGIDLELMEFESAMYSEYFDDETGELWDFIIWGIGSSNDATWKQLYTLDINQGKTGVNHLQIADEKLQSLYDTAANVNTNSTESVNELLSYVTDNCYEYGMFYYTLIYFGTDKVTKIVTGAGNSESIYNAFELK